MHYPDEMLANPLRGPSNAMSSSDSSALVDDSNPRVQYQPGWDWQQGVLEVDATRHAASIAGLTAWLPFVGNSIAVVGTIGESGTYGQPKTTYSIDGKVMGSYEAPFVDVGNAQYNVTFFTADGLSAGDHIVLVNSTEGSPNTFFLDYFLIGTPDSPAPPAEPGPSSMANSVPAATPTPSPAALPASTASPSKSSTPQAPPSTPSPSATPGPSVPQSAYPTSVSTVVSFVTVPVASPQPSTTGSGAALSDNSARSSSSNTGAIAGGTVCGVVVLAVLVAIIFCLRRRRRRNVAQTGGMPLPFSQVQEAYHAQPGHEAYHTHPDVRSPTVHSPAMQESAFNGGVIHLSPPAEHNHRAATGPPSELSTSATSAASQYNSPRSPSDYARSTWLASQSLTTELTRSPTSVSTPLTSYPSEPTEKSHSPPSAPSTLSLAASTSLSTLPTSNASLHTPLVSPSACGSLTPVAVVPPGEWHAPPESHPHAQSLLRLLFSPRTSRASMGTASSPATPGPHDVDSGLRLYSEPVLPPPYTQE
ncbi:hypothetical protein BC628DRAFT_1415157 [Trametes gibbosa]|nr:hypothetical protein BC628DRAFT_1415157 [Trametes gibbosa]